MDAINYRMHGDELVISLSGRITAANSAEIEAGIDAALQECPCAKVVLDLDKLTYISSAGLRVFLRLGKRVERLRIENAGPVPYDVLEMTGFSEMFEVTKAYRRISTDGLEVIGRGAKGAVYRIDDETIVKVSFDETEGTIEQIDRERKLARSAFVAGIPTAISYDVVRVGNGYGAVYELLNAKTLGQMLSSGEITVDEAAKLSIDLLKIIHKTEVDPNSMPSERDIVLDWVDYLKGHLEDGLWQKLHDLVAAVPEDNHLIHGDYHLKNIMVQNGETLLIDMDTLCHGNPIFELASIYNAYVGFSQCDPSVVLKFQGFDEETAHELWHKSLVLYLETTDEERIRSVEEKAAIVGQTRLLRRTLRRDGDPAMVAATKARLEELVPKTDTLLF